MSNLLRFVIGMNGWPSNSNYTLHCHWSAFKTTKTMTMQRVIRIPVTNLGRLDICKFQLAFSAGRLLLNSVKEKYIM